MSREPVDIGLPDLSESDIEGLAEECEAEITRYILHRVPKKSIGEMFVNCTIELGSELELDVQLDLVQSYDTGLELDNLLHEATVHATHWLEIRLRELKND
ncbi:MAG: DUF3194 domain-containing protein [Candidatus Thorarchaeota archaeon]|jgi:hypothetical protein